MRQIADDPSINLVFDRLYVDGKGVPFKYVPEPDPDSYEGKRPEARLYAPRLGISTSFEFEPNPAGSNGRRLHGIQTLLYPADLERQAPEDIRRGENRRRGDGNQHALPRFRLPRVL